MDSGKISNQKNSTYDSSIKEDTGILEKHFSQSLSSCSSKPKVGWLCTYTPEELINAAGFIPVRIFGSKKIDRSESYFPINFCPYLKSAWESILESSPGLEGIVFTTSCDGMRRLYDTAASYKPEIPSFMLDVPRTGGKRQISFFASNIARMQVFLEKISGRKIGSGQIQSSTGLINKKRALLSKLGGLLYRMPDIHGIISIADYYKILQIAMESDPEIFTGELAACLDIFKSGSAGMAPDTPYNIKKSPSVMIMGNFITENRLWDMLSGLDIRLVAEDLCLSSRYFEKEVDTCHSGDILELISARYLAKPACMRMADPGIKLKELEEKVTRQKVKGLIFISLKFCDTMLYSFPLVKKRFLELKIPVLYLEIEYNNFSAGQLKTRIQAFLEML